MSELKYWMCDRCGEVWPDSDAPKDKPEQFSAHLTDCCMGNVNKSDISFSHLCRSCVAKVSRLLVPIEFLPPVGPSASDG